MSTQSHDTRCHEPPTALCPHPMGVREAEGLCGCGHDRDAHGVGACTELTASLADCFCSKWRTPAEYNASLCRRCLYPEEDHRQWDRELWAVCPPAYDALDVAYDEAKLQFAAVAR